MLSSRFMLIASLLLGSHPLPAMAQGDDLQTVTVDRQEVVRERLLDGTVEAVSRATMTAQTSGRISEIYYDVDDYVERGEVLLRFVDTEQQANLKQAKAGLLEAQARHREARSEYQRVRDIFAKNLVSKSAMDRAEASLRAAEARLESARAQVAAAEEQLGYTVVEAPYSGIVTERHVEVGEVASPGEPLFSGVSLDKLRVNAHVPQRLINRVREIGKARVLLDGNGKTFASESLTLFPYADPGSNSFRVRVNLPEGVEGLFPGMFVKVAFTVGEEKRLLVPVSAVAHRSEVNAVYVVDEQGMIHMRHVRLGRQVDDEVIVLAGLEAGEQVALDPIAATIALKEQMAAASQPVAGEH